MASAPRVGHALVDDGLDDRADLVVGDASEAVGGHGHDDREDAARQVGPAGGGVVVGGVVERVDGKANRLAALIRSNLAMAMQGLAVVPLFAGFDLTTDQGRIFSYDVTGGRYEETAFHAVGSGSLFARGSLKKLYRDDLVEEDCVTAVVQALYDAADDDSATGGPDLTRRIFPVVQVVTADGGRRMPDADVAEIADRMIAGRMNRPDGPAAPLT